MVRPYSSYDVKTVVSSCSSRPGRRGREGEGFFLHGPSTSLRESASGKTTGDAEYLKALFTEFSPAIVTANGGRRSDGDTSSKQKYSTF